MLNKTAFAVAALFVFIGFSVGAAPSSALAATYYVSPTGSDSNNGLSTSTPWQTLAKVNASSFNAGDSVLLQGGQTFAGCLTFTPANLAGNKNNPFTIASYGTGQATVQATVACWVPVLPRTARGQLS